jgi:3-oxoacyl-[acyl-carrier-protein] synthase II
MSDPIYITGQGLVSAYGMGNEAFATAYNGRVSAIRARTLFDAPACREERAAEVPDFDPAPLLGKRGLKSCDRSTQLLMAATELLLGRLGLADREARRARFTDEEFGIVVGTLGSIKSIADFDLETIRNPQYVTPTLFPNTVFCAAASYVAIRHGIKESCITLGNDEPSALSAFGFAMGRLRRRRARHIVVGATHELSEIYALGVQRACDRAGRPAPILGEGAAAFSVEPASVASERGAAPVAELLACSALFCPEKQRAYERNLEALRAQAGAGVLEGVAHVVSAEKSDLDDLGPIRGGARLHRLYPRLGYLSAAAGAFGVAAALADRTVEEGAVVLVNAASDRGNCASLLLRKLASA